VEYSTAKSNIRPKHEDNNASNYYVEIRQNSHDNLQQKLVYKHYLVAVISKNMLFQRIF